MRKGEKSHPKLEERRWGRSLGWSLVAGVDEGRRKKSFHVAFTFAQHKHTHTFMRGKEERKEKKRKIEEGMLTGKREEKEAVVVVASRRRRWSSGGFKNVMSTHTH